MQAFGLFRVCVSEGLGKGFEEVLVVPHLGDGHTVQLVWTDKRTQEDLGSNFSLRLGLNKTGSENNSTQITVNSGTESHTHTPVSCPRSRQVVLSRFLLMRLS